MILTSSLQILTSSLQLELAERAGHHGYHVKLRLAGLVPEETLRLTPAAVAEACAEDWRVPLGV